MTGRGSTVSLQKALSELASYTEVNLKSTYSQNHP